MKNKDYKIRLNKESSFRFSIIRTRMPYCVNGENRVNFLSMINGDHNRYVFENEEVSELIKFLKKFKKSIKKSNKE